MLIKEFRITNNCSNAEYKIAQLYNVAEMSKAESGGGEGVKIEKNEPYEDKKHKGQYTHKIYNLDSKIPPMVKNVLPVGATECHEHAWNAFPWCKTEISNKYMGEYFYITVESLHVDGDRGEMYNALSLSSDELAQREVIYIDVANDSKEYSVLKYNPATENVGAYRSEKALRGPLQGDWSKTCDPVMTCYKVVRIKFKWFGIQTLVESFIARAERELFTRFHRELFTSMDKWYGLTIEDIREMENKTKEELALKFQLAAAGNANANASG